MVTWLQKTNENERVLAEANCVVAENENERTEQRGCTGTISFLALLSPELLCRQGSAVISGTIVL